MTTPAPPQPPAIDPRWRDLLEGGCSLVVATVGHGGRPHASRGWGVTVLDGDRARIRLLLDADDAALEANLRGGSRLAVNGTDVRTLDSVQTKGRVVSLEEADAVDRRRMRRHCDLFWGAVEEVDGFPREMTAHLIPRRLLACVAELDEWYDQTPGPNAGQSLADPDAGPGSLGGR